MPHTPETLAKIAARVRLHNEQHRVALAVALGRFAESTLSAIVAQARSTAFLPYARTSLMRDLARAELARRKRL